MTSCEAPTCEAYETRQNFTADGEDGDAEDPELQHALAMSLEGQPGMLLHMYKGSVISVDLCSILLLL